MINKKKYDNIYLTIWVFLTSTLRCSLKLNAGAPAVVNIMQTDSDMLNTPSPSSAVNQKQTTVAGLVTCTLREWREEKKKKSKHALDCQASDTT